MMYRRGAPPAREDRCVDVDAAEPRHGEDRRRQQESVRRDHQHVEVQGLEHPRRFGGTHAAGLMDFDPGRQGTPLDGTQGDSIPASGMGIAPGERRLDAMVGIDEEHPA